MDIKRVPNGKQKPIAPYRFFLRNSHKQLVGGAPAAVKWCNENFTPQPLPQAAAFASAVQRVWAKEY